MLTASPAFRRRVTIVGDEPKMFVEIDAQLRRQPRDLRPDSGVARGLAAEPRRLARAQLFATPSPSQAQQSTE